MKSVSTQYSVVRKLLFISTFPVLLTSCLWRSPVEVVIVDKKTTLTERPLIIKCIPPLYRSRDSVAVKFVFSEKWNIYTNREQERRGFEFGNGKVVFLKVALIGHTGRRYVNDSVTLSGDDVTMGFGILPTNAKIVKIEITSSIEVECSKIYWYCYDPI